MCERDMDSKFNDDFDWWGITLVMFYKFFTELITREKKNSVFGLLVPITLDYDLYRKNVTLPLKCLGLTRFHSLSDVNPSSPSLPPF